MSLIGWIPFLVLQPAPAEDWYRLEVTLVTDSDWTAVRFENAGGFWVEDQKVRTAGPVQVRTGALSLNKPSMDRTGATLDAVVHVTLPAEGDLEVVVTRGSIGSTRVSIKDVGELVHDTPTGEGTNRRVFKVGAAKVRALGARRFEPRRLADKLVLAFYYPWYGTPEGPSKRWVHWDPQQHNAATNTPRLGLYDSHDEGLIRKHIEWARQAGVDGFISSWWGRGGFEDRATRKLLAAAEKEKFLVTVYHEQAKDARQLEEDFAYLVREYGASGAWLKAGGKPVIFVYTRVVGDFKPEDFSKARGEAVLLMDTFDVGYGRAGGGLHAYNPVFTDLARLKKDYKSARYACAAQGLVFAATVVPGYDDTVIRKPGGRRDREGGKFYDASWECALSCDPDWILVCSWNEWHEGSEIEPSKEDGDRALRQTAEWVRRWKGK